MKIYVGIMAGDWRGTYLKELGLRDRIKSSKDYWDEIKIANYTHCS
jgi:hypothetical protein